MKIFGKEIVWINKPTLVDLQIKLKSLARSCEANGWVNGESVKEYRELLEKIYKLGGEPEVFIKYKE